MTAFFLGGKDIIIDAAVCDSEMLLTAAHAEIP